MPNFCLTLNRTEQNSGFLCCLILTLNIEKASLYYLSNPTEGYFLFMEIQWIFSLEKVTVGTIPKCPLLYSKRDRNEATCHTAPLERQVFSEKQSFPMWHIKDRSAIFFWFVLEQSRLTVFPTGKWGMVLQEQPMALHSWNLNSHEV